ncbi:hypothetical protein BDQ17DRAFT_1283867 [Cyathus striatus]|nr:hypothetical protein BDQ17DRAFT_1283867 [Cyathus striatus]
MRLATPTRSLLLVLIIAFLVVLFVNLNTESHHPRLRSIPLPYVYKFLDSSNEPLREPLDSPTTHDTETPVPLTHSEAHVHEFTLLELAPGVITETTIPVGAHVHGFTVFDHLYVRNGTFYVVTSDVSSFPPRRNLIGRPVEMDKDFEPTDEDLQFIDPLTASQVLGDHAVRISGFSVIIYDHSQFMNHFYHWWGEIILGAWRVYSKLAGTENEPACLPFPTRFLIPMIEASKWRDHSGVSGPLMRGAFPEASIEKSTHWQDLIKLNSTFVFDRSMIIHRGIAGRHPFGSRWFKMIGGTMNLTVADDFWEPVRQSLVQNSLGYIPKIDDSKGVVLPPLNEERKTPVVTYISRQGGGRRLIHEDHLGLVKVLRELESDGICEVNVAMMERMSMKEQIAAAARSTIIVGVHGNGLTHQLWMQPSLRSAVFEIWYPPSYVWDYEMLARNMGHKHYGVWNDTFITFPKGTYYEGVKIVEGFHSNSIPVYMAVKVHI